MYVGIKHGAGCYCCFVTQIIMNMMQLCNTHLSECFPLTRKSEINAVFWWLTKFFSWKEFFSSVCYPEGDTISHPSILDDNTRKDYLFQVMW